MAQFVTINSDPNTGVKQQIQKLPALLAEAGTILNSVPEWLDAYKANVHQETKQVVEEARQSLELLRTELAAKSDQVEDLRQRLAIFPQDIEIAQQMLLEHIEKYKEVLATFVEQQQRAGEQAATLLIQLEEKEVSLSKLLTQADVAFRALTQNYAELNNRVMSLSTKLDATFQESLKTIETKLVEESSTMFRNMLSRMGQ